MLSDTITSVVLEQHFASDRDPLGAAFVKRGSSHWMMGRPVPVAQPHTVYSTLMAQAGVGKRSAYLHIPFCANHCLFCGFYRHRADESEIHAYVGQLLREIAMDAPLATAARPIHAVYFGGGTPSALSAGDLYDLILAVRSRLPLAPDCEITVEGRVVGFTPEKVEACLAAGANRFSIGVQSFDSDLRRRFGRKAARGEVMDFMRFLKETDRAAVVCDLIYGLPGQSLDLWRQDIETCIELECDGVDLYGLSLFEKGPLAQSIAKGALPSPPATPEMARMYAVGLDMLEAAGWRHLTQAHWARTTRERNVYNPMAKSGADCLAFGAGAGGMLAGHRFMLDGEAVTYGRRIAAGEKPIALMISPQPMRAVRNRIGAGLEVGYLDLCRLEQETAPGLMAALDPLLAQWASAGLIRRRGAAVVPLTPGWFWLSNLSDSLVQLTMQHLGAAAVPPTGVPHHVH